MKLQSKTKKGVRDWRLLEKWSWVLLGGGILAHVCFLLSLTTGWLNPLFNDSMHRFGPGCDFFSIYAESPPRRHGDTETRSKERTGWAPGAAGEGVFRAD